ncbi:hypothetical protein, partial [Enterococcus dongliensis]|uniref:hypothetical protein n=1 Tax=Enterococcus dongliensis TaxID=2559925 RepID=UPI0028914950
LGGTIKKIKKEVNSSSSFKVHVPSLCHCGGKGKVNQKQGEVCGQRLPPQTCEAHVQLTIKRGVGKHAYPVSCKVRILASDLDRKVA